MSDHTHKTSAKHGRLKITCIRLIVAAATIDIGNMGGGGIIDSSVLLTLKEVEQNKYGGLSGLSFQKGI